MYIRAKRKTAHPPRNRKISSGHFNIAVGPYLRRGRGDGSLTLLSGRLRLRIVVHERIQFFVQFFCRLWFFWSRTGWPRAFGAGWSSTSRFASDKGGEIANS